jgi:hypothetical protein
MSALKNLEDWYRSQCDGDWEHAYGVRIGTLDNPGWKIEVDLQDTGLETRTFDPFSVERSETDWVHASREGEKFHVFGGPSNLEEMINLFLEWACLVRT